MSIEKLTYRVTIGDIQIVKEVPEADRENITKIFLDHIWNSYRIDTSWMLGDIANWINKYGGERSRSEGLKMIRRVHKRLLEQV